MKNTKRGILLFLASCLLISAICVYAAASGSETVLIQGETDFVNFVRRVNNGENNEKSLNARLLVDLNLNGYQWEPIRDYSGTFDGGGYTISWTSYQVKTDQSGQSYGLFAAVREGGTVKNLHVRGDYNVTCTGNRVILGGITGVCDGGSVLNCTFAGNLTATALKGCTVGGIAGTLQGEDQTARIVNCAYLSGTIQPTAKDQFVGGLIGGMNGIKETEPAQLINCYSGGTVPASGESAAALVGEASYARVERCYYASRGVPANVAPGAEVVACYTFDDTYTVTVDGVPRPLVDCLNDYVTGAGASLELKSWSANPTEGGRPGMDVPVEKPPEPPTPSTEPTPEVTATPSTEPTPEETTTPSAEPTPTEQVTPPTPTPTEQVTPTPVPSESPTPPKPTPTPTAEPTPTPTPTPSAEPTPTPTPTPSTEPTPTPTPTPSTEPTPTPTPTPSAEPTPTPTPTPSAEPTPTPTPSTEPTPTPTPTPSAEPTPTPTPTPSTEPTPTPTPTPSADVERTHLTLRNPLAAEKIYDGSTAVEVSAEGLVGVREGDDVRLRAQQVSGQAESAQIGTHPVSVHFELEGQDSARYILDQPENLLVTISPRLVELAWSFDSATYNGEEQEVTARVTNAVEGDSVNITGYEQNRGVDAGSYIATVTGVDNYNYTVLHASGHVWRIEKAQPTAELFEVRIDAQGAHVTLKTELQGLGAYYPLYGDSRELPTQGGLYPVYLCIEEGRNYLGATLAIGQLEIAEPSGGGGGQPPAGGGGGTVPSGPGGTPPQSGGGLSGPTLGSASASESGTDFSDVAPGRWSHDAIERVVRAGLMRGVGDGRFAPEATASRAMLVTVLWRVFGQPLTDAPIPYKDVAADSWYGDAVAWGAQKALVQGYKDGTFRPDQALTREQTVTLLLRALAMEGIDPAPLAQLPVLYDLDSCSGWARADMERAVSCGLIGGNARGQCRPGASLSREELAVLLCRYLDLHAQALS